MQELTLQFSLASRLRADQVAYEIYNQDRPRYTFPTPKVEGPIAKAESIVTYKIAVTTPPGEIAVQVIKPTADATTAGGLVGKDGLLPAYIDFHGGGFVIGSLATDLGFCQNVAHHVGCAVVNVDYRLAPDFPHPTPTTDSFDALQWVVRHARSRLGIDASRLAVGGFSAGGCLAAALAIMARGDGDGDGDGEEIPPLRLQLLVVPVLDARYVPEEEEGKDEEGACAPALTATTPYQSYVHLEHAPCLPLQRLMWFYKLWLGTGATRTAKANDFRASPMVAASHANLAPASIHCAELDPLIDEGNAYHEKLMLEGTRSDLKVYKGVGHPFGHWAGELPAAREFHENVYTALREAFKLR